METHAHDLHKDPSQGWKHYFFEFFMLFLAVFCGFLAENQRERYGEHQREREFAETLLEDLNNDILDLNRVIPNWQDLIADIDTVRNQLEKEPAERDHLMLYKCAAHLVTNSTLPYHDRTIVQLKNAGDFRLMRNKGIPDSLVEYDAQVTSMRDLEQRYTVIYFQNREVLQEQLFNTKYFGLRYQPEKLAAAAIQEPDIFKIHKGKEDISFQYYNSLFALKYQTQVRVRILKELMEKAENLTVMIKDGYHLK